MKDRIVGRIVARGMEGRQDGEVVAEVGGVSFLVAIDAVETRMDELDAWGRSEVEWWAAGRFLATDYSRCSRAVA